MLVLRSRASKMAALLMGLSGCVRAAVPPRDGGSPAAVSPAPEASEVPALASDVPAPPDAAPAPASTCHTMADVQQLSILGGRPYGVFPMGARRLDRPDDPVAPLGSDWPRLGGDALGDRPEDLQGSWPDRLVVQVARQKGNFPASDAYLLQRGRWRRLVDPPDVVGYLRAAPAGNGRVVAIGVVGFTTRLVVLAGPDRFPGANAAPGTATCVTSARVFELAVSPGGRVAVTRERCTDRTGVVPAQVEVFDEKLRSRSRTPLEGAQGLSFLAWLDDETLLASFTLGSSTGPGRLVRITRGKLTELTLPSREAALGLSRTAEGKVIVSTERQLLVVGRDGELEGAPLPLPGDLELDVPQREFVHRVALGEDGARYFDVVGSRGRRVVRCTSPQAGAGVP